MQLITGSDQDAFKTQPWLLIATWSNLSNFPAKLQVCSHLPNGEYVHWNADIFWNITGLYVIMQANQMWSSDHHSPMKQLHLWSREHMLPFDSVINMFPGAGHWRDTFGKNDGKERADYVLDKLSGHILMDKVRYLGPTKGLTMEW